MIHCSPQEPHSHPEKLDEINMRIMLRFFHISLLDWGSMLVKIHVTVHQHEQFYYLNLDQLIANVDLRTTRVAIIKID